MSKVVYLVKVGRMSPWRKVSKQTYLKYEALAGFSPTFQGEPSVNSFELTNEAGNAIYCKIQFERAQGSKIASN